MTNTLRRRSPGRPSVSSPSGATVLLREAQSAFARYGYEQASVRKIAASAGFDPALVAHHFGSKEALWDAVIERFALYLAPHVTALGALQSRKDLSPRERLEKAFQQFVDVVCEEPEGGMLLAHTLTEDKAKFELLVQKLFWPYSDAFEPLLSVGMREGLIPAQPLHSLYFILFNSVTMTVAFRHVLGLFGESYGDLEQVKHDVTNFLVSTILRSPLKG
jgi:TetR/AcrR family transcriptional regulator